MSRGKGFGRRDSAWRGRETPTVEPEDERASKAKLPSRVES